MWRSNFRLLGLPFVLAFFLGLAWHPTKAHGSPSDGLPTEFHPNFALFGGGPLLNLKVNGQWDDRAVTNAAAHVGFAVAVPMAGYYAGGRKGMWIAGLSWIGLSLFTETLMHAPPNAGPMYASEFRTDLASKIIPTAAILLWDYFSHR